MKRFKFRLQRVLEVRERIRDELRQELARRNMERDNEAQRLEDLRAEALTIGVAPGGTYSATHMVMLAEYSARLKLEIAQQMVRLEEAIKAAEEARDKYIEASRDARALETLKQKRKDEYTEEMLKQEGNTLDELATQRSFRRERL